MMARDFVPPAGMFDTMFGSAAVDAAVLDNGKILVLGSGVVNSRPSMVVVRLNSTLALDTTFGSGGITSVAAKDVSATDIKVLADGKILILGESNGDLLFARFHPKGTLDKAFGTNGLKKRDWGFDDKPAEMTVKSDGRILVAGTTNKIERDDIDFGDFVLARYKGDDNLSIDSTFGDGGRTTIDSDWSDVAVGLRQVSGGKILLAGFSSLYVLGHGEKPADIALVRLNSNGAPDTSFDDDGLKLVKLVGNDQLYDFLVDSSGRILLSGPGYVARLKATGARDRTFADEGVFRFETGRDLRYPSTDISVRPDGTIVVVGTQFGNGESYFACMRLRDNGTYDTSFSGDGFATNNVLTALSGPEGQEEDYAFGMAVLPNGKILAVGSADIAIFAVTTF